MSFFDNRDRDVIDLPSSLQKPRRFAGLALLLVAALSVLTIWVFPTPYVIEQPGPTYNVLGAPNDEPIIEINGAEVYQTEGNLDLLTVQVVGSPQRTPSWADIVLAWFDPAKSVVPIEQIFPANQTKEESEAESSAMMEQSQQEAIAASLKKLGYEVPVNIYVSLVTKGSPSSGKLVASDFVRSVNGKSVATIEELRAAVNEYDGKTALEIAVERDGKSKSYQISPIKDAEGAWRLGVMVGYKYEFPVDVKLQLADVGGPSGGMMFALGIYDKLTPGAITGGKYIAGTGTISADGTIGAIGGIQQKLYGAAAKGAEFFLAPAKNCAEVVGHIPQGLKVFKVSTFDDALTAVTAIGKNQDTSTLATCNTN